MFKKYPIYYIAFIVMVMASWLGYCYTYDLFTILADYWHITLTMVFGSFVAGSSPEGSAAIAYPIFTLFFKIEPETTRNFAFAIQSFGMTSASIFILNKKIAIDRKYILLTLMTGIPGLLFGTEYIAPFIQPKVAKLFFVSLWFSFALILWHLNKNQNRHTHTSLPTNLNYFDVFLLLFFGFIGGVISSIFGTGINIITYCFVVIYFGMNEKVATPSSVIIMTIETIIGFVLHMAWLKDFNTESKHMWLACIPVVILFAPLGAYLIQKLNRILVANLLTLILMIQFIGAFITIRPTGNLLYMSIGTILLGLLLFYVVYKKRLVEPKSRIE